MALSSHGPLQESHSLKMILTVFELTSYEPFVVTDVEGLFGACCHIVSSKLLQDPILLVEDDLSYPSCLKKNNFDFDNLLASWEVKAAVII